MREVRIEERLVGNGHPCFIAAEIGINHNGNMDLAHKLIDAAADAGADAVKFQNYYTEDFLFDRSLTYEYISEEHNVIESQYDMFKRYELSPSMLRELKTHCQLRGITFFSTPSSEKGLADLVSAGTHLLKNGSDYLVHLPLIRSMAKSRLPTVLSTGMATLAEIDDAVRAFRESGGKDLILLHCTSSYPTTAEDVHLRKIPALKAVFGCPVGLSDHTDGIVAAIGAVALGACFIEKHFTLDRKMPGPDHRFSADPAELGALTKSIRTLEKSLGSSEIVPTQSEMKGRRDFRLSCIAAHNLPAGQSLSESDVAFCRPGRGLPPKALDWLVDKKLKSAIRAGDVLKLEDFI